MLGGRECGATVALNKPVNSGNQYVYAQHEPSCLLFQLDLTQCFCVILRLPPSASLESKSPERHRNFYCVVVDSGCTLANYHA